MSGFMCTENNTEIWVTAKYAHHVCFKLSNRCTNASVRLYSFQINSCLDTCLHTGKHRLSTHTGFYTLRLAGPFRWVNKKKIKNSSAWVCFYLQLYEFVFLQQDSGESLRRFEALESLINHYRRVMVTRVGIVPLIAPLNKTQIPDSICEGTNGIP